MMKGWREILRRMQRKQGKSNLCLTPERWRLVVDRDRPALARQVQEGVGCRDILTE